MNDPRPARLTAADFDPDVLKLFDQYVHGAIDRRGFLDKASRVAAAGGTTAAALLAALSPDFAYGQKVAPNDARIRTERVEIPSTGGHGKIAALVARPANASAALPVVLVVHENRGLNPHIEDIARRLAVDNFIAVAPDALSPSGGYPGDEDKARGAFDKLDAAKTSEDFVAATTWARTVAGGNGKVGAVGFCWGGTIVNFIATRSPELVAGAPFYGAAPPLDAVKNIKAEMMMVFAALRRSAEGRRRAPLGLHLSGHATRLQQRHDAALRREGGAAGLGADAGAVQPNAAGLGRGPGSHHRPELPRHELVLPVTVLLALGLAA
jgi:carboxymethylenebutenolidase